jgi:hypothetical protein
MLAIQLLPFTLVNTMVPQSQAIEQTGIVFTFSKQIYDAFISARNEPGYEGLPRFQCFYPHTACDENPMANDSEDDVHSDLDSDVDNSLVD